MTVATGADRNCGIQIEARIQNIHGQCCTNGLWRATAGETPAIPGYFAQEWDRNNFQLALPWNTPPPAKPVAI